jgi:acyl-CoA dehydrogenase
MGRASGKARKLADAAGHLRFAWPKAFGGKGGSNLWMAVIREHLASQGPGPVQRPAERALDRRQQSLRADVPRVRHARISRTIDGDKLQGRLPRTLRPDRARPRLRRHLHGDPRGARDPRRARLADQRREDVDDRHARRHPRDGLRRTSGKDGDAKGITCFIVPADTPRGEDRGVSGPSTCRPTTRGSASPTSGAGLSYGARGTGPGLGQSFVHQNRIRQAASSLGAAVFCIEREREVRPRAQAVRQGAGREPGDPVAAGRAARPSARCCAC